IFASLSFPLSSALPELWNKAAHGGSVSGVKARSRRLLQLHRRRFLSPRGGGFVSSAVVGLDPGGSVLGFGFLLPFGFTLLVWLEFVEISSEDDRSSTMVNGDGSREALLSVVVMNAPVDPGESTVSYPMVFRSEGDVGAAAFVRAAAEPRLS
ncbi:unnamed protein product, partial [Brassica oleracea var. botrytis]